MKKIIKNSIKYAGIYSATIIIFIILLLIASIFPSKIIERNVKKSSDILLEETKYKEIYVPYKFINISMDNHTDALMLNTAYSIDNSSPLYSAFVARKNYIPGKTKQISEEKVGELDFDKKYKELNQVEELNDTINGEVLESFEYARYWHGYLTVIRPLLILFDVNMVRIIFRIIFTVLAIILLYLIYKKIDLLTAIIFFIGLTAVEYWYIGISLQGSFVFFIMMISTIIILLRYEKIKSFSTFFFIIGMLTNFFDFLTVPILTLGVPLIIYYLLKQKQNKNTSIKELFTFSIIWAVGYIFTWFGKWVLLDVLYNKNIFEVVINQIIYRSSNISYGEQISYFKILYINYIWIIGTISIELLVVYILKMIKFLYSKNEKISFNINKNLIPFFIIAIMPFIWYGVIKNHSYNHSFFTYRNLLLTIIGVSILFKKMINERSFK